MKTRTLAVGGCLLASLGSLGSLASAQSSVDRSFSASARDCSSVQWSAAALQKYPKIASACQEVLERGGTSYVKFQGTLTQNIGRGDSLKVKFKDADEMTLTPPPELKVYVDGRKVPVEDLQRGDQLTFYVAEDRLAAQFYADNGSPATTNEYVIVPIVYTEQVASMLPETGSKLPLIAMLGLLLITFAIMLNVRRLIRRF